MLIEQVEKLQKRIQVAGRMTIEHGCTVGEERVIQARVEEWRLELTRILVAMNAPTRLEIARGIVGSDVFQVSLEEALNAPAADLPDRVTTDDLLRNAVEALDLLARWTAGRISRHGARYSEALQGAVSELYRLLPGDEGLHAWLRLLPGRG